MEKGNIRLNSSKDCRKFLARCINETQNGKMKSDLLRTLTYSLKTLVGILSDSDLESRIEKLEQTILKGANTNG